MNRQDWQVVKLIRQVMEHRAPVFRCQLESLIELRGQEFVLDILAKTLKVEMDGGMMIDDGSRRRTRDGTYIKLAKANLNAEHKRQLEKLTRAKLKAHRAWAKQKEAGILAQQNAALEALDDVEVVAEPEIVEVVNAPAPQAVAPKPETQKPKNEKSTKPAAHNKHDFAAARQARFQKAPPPSDIIDDLPPAVNARLRQLEGAVNVLRERVQQLESKPAGQQVGLEMARKLLSSNEGQIAALLAEYTRSEGVS